MIKPNLSFWQIIAMNFGFFGIQFSFGLQQSNMSPIYRYLGADEASLPYLWLAGPMTGLLVQPIIGALSDRTISRWGRRTPYFLIGAVFCSISLFFMPFSSELWMAAGLLWILDAANNIAMEPYRAFVGDKLNENQLSKGFLIQSAFTGLGQTLSYLLPSMLVVMGMDRDYVNEKNIPYITITAFLVGSIFSIGSVVVSVTTVKEIPLTEPERERIRQSPRGIRHAFLEIIDAFKEMPPTMKQLALMKLFQWYAMFCYWQYIVLAIARGLYETSDERSAKFREASLTNGQLGGFYNLIAFISAFLLIRFSNRWGPQITHASSLILAAAGMICIPFIDTKTLLFIPMIGIGIGWASMMGNPYVMLASSIPSHRTGVYMGIFNMFIVIPMMIQIFTLPLIYDTWLGGNPENVILLAGGLLLLAAVAVLFVRTPKSAINSNAFSPAGH